MFSADIVFKLASVLFCCALCEAFTHLEETFPLLREIRSQPASDWTVEDFVRGYGYPIETHTVKTEDKYILTLHRIPYGKSGPSANRPVVYIQHGLFFNSASWLVTGPKNSIAFLYADAGYDVWIGNARGSTLSRKHETIDPDENPNEFFDFTFHEMGKRDMPSVVDYILLVTQQAKLSYVGHSMGTTMFFTFLSERPEYNAKIKVMFAMSPFVYLQGPITATGFRKFEQIESVGDSFGVYEIFSYKQFLEHYEDQLCGLSDFWASFCEFKLQLLAAVYSSHINATASPILFKTVPAGVTVKTIAHYAQLSRPFSEFRQFDYGHPLKNFLQYRSFSPPLYDLSKITCPIYLYYGGDDVLTPHMDMHRLAFKFSKNLLSVIKVKGYKQNDFLLGEDAKFLYNIVIQKDKAIS